MKKNAISFERRTTLYGLMFCAPFLLGFVLFFLVPAVQSARYAFSSIKLDEAGINLTFVGLANFREALLADPQYVRLIAESVREMLIRIPVILSLSIFIALLLNKKFPGRALARAVFFLPVIVMSGVVLEILQADALSNAILYGEPAAALESVAYDIFNLVWSSGVQILLFLAGLQSIPGPLYECAKIEGAGAWEAFWKITFPLISPMILMNVVYTATDYFTTSVNPVIRMIGAQSSNMRFEYAAGLSWMYLIVAMIILAAIYIPLNKRVVYIAE